MFSILLFLGTLLILWPHREALSMPWKNLDIKDPTDLNEVDSAIASAFWQSILKAPLFELSLVLLVSYFASRYMF